ncbi:MAG: acyl carrier protein [Deltaproteobacteria bacterium]|nr:MAG: acyl carrier protein [Deltaproteobacteria bacterium]
MNIFERVKKIVADILDIEEQKILSWTYLIRELGAESIDLLELAVSLNAGFQIEIRDDDIFLRKLRRYLEEAKEKGLDQHSYLAGQYPFLSNSRIGEILKELKGGPVLTIEDLVSYISYYQNK